MNVIPAEIVEHTWTLIGEMEDEELAQLMNDVGETQPFLLAYLLSIGDEGFNQEEKDLLLFLGVSVWKMMSQGKGKLPIITEEALAEVEANNIKMLEYLSGESESNFLKTTTTILDAYNQPHILRYVIEEIVDEDVSLISDENRGMIFIYLKIMIDCLDRDA